MKTHDELAAMLAKMPKLSYFEILGLPHRYTKPAELKAAFHAFAQLYHPDQYAGDDEPTRELAREVFKRAVEAYEVLRDGDLQKRYVEKYLKKGDRRLPSNAFGKEEPVVRPPPPKVPTTWIEEMTTEDGREVATRIDKMIAGNRLQAAFQQFGILETLEPQNLAVKKKLNELKRKMGLRQPIRRVPQLYVEMTVVRLRALIAARCSADRSKRARRATSSPRLRGRSRGASGRRPSPSRRRACRRRR